MSDDKSNKKLFSSNKDQKCDISGISPLKKDGIPFLWSGPKEKAEILNNQYSSYFATEVRTAQHSSLIFAQVQIQTCQPYRSWKMALESRYVD